MILLRFCLVITIAFVISMHVYIEIFKQNNRGAINSYITKCQALSRNVVDKFRKKGLRSNQLFYDKLYDEVVKECVKLEIIR